MNKPLFDITGKRVWVAGSRGLVGSAMLRRLRDENCHLIADPHRDDLDLRDANKTRDFIDAAKPDVIILAAAKVGGIADNAANPTAFYHDNLAIQNAVINGAAQTGVQKLVFLGSSCIYPRLCLQPIMEEYLKTGDLEPTNESYARAKIAGIEQIQDLRARGHDYIAVMPCNLYGANDHFMGGDRPHVIPALMHKIYQATDRLDVWGTGTPLREFLHVDDVADGILHALRFYSDSQPLNIGSGMEISIADLVTLLCDIAAFKGQIIFDPTKPDGTPRKILDSSRMRALGWIPSIPLREGLETVWTDFVNQAQRGDYQRG